MLFPDFSHASSVERPLRRLGEEECRLLGVLSAFLEGMGRWEGPAYHRWMGKALDAGLASDDELKGWLEDRWAGEGLSARKRAGISARRWDRARALARERRREGVRIHVWSQGFPHREMFSPCPRVLFSVGEERKASFRTAVFNSRKPRLISPGEPWLVFLRKALEELAGRGAGLASSLDVTTYDLTSLYAVDAGAPLRLVLPSPLEDALRSSFLDGEGMNVFGASRFVCRPKAVKCGKALRMVCRDGLLAALADAHLVVDVRRGGNLHALLDRQHRLLPKPLWICRLPGEGSRSANGDLLKTFSHAVSVAVGAQEKAFSPLSSPRRSPPVKLVAPEVVNWREYLYHYTRARPGPWPGQSRAQYLRSLLRGEQGAAHTALDTLARILQERRLRGSALMVRGKGPVTSWTSLPPADVRGVTRWNPALVRWTFEPYGLAVRRNALKRLGCRPAVYASETACERLPPSQRFRFQLHEPPRCSWKREREWRLPGDFCLNDLDDHEAFVMVREHREVERLAGAVSFSWAVLVLADLPEPP